MEKYISRQYASVYVGKRLLNPIFAENILSLVFFGYYRGLFRAIVNIKACYGDILVTRFKLLQMKVQTEYKPFTFRQRC